MEWWKLMRLQRSLLWLLLAATIMATSTAGYEVSSQPKTEKLAVRRSGLVWCGKGWGLNSSSAPLDALPCIALTEPE